MITRQQRVALHRVWLRNDQGKSYRQFRKSATHGMYGCATTKEKVTGSLGSQPRTALAWTASLFTGQVCGLASSPTATHTVRSDYGKSQNIKR